MRFLEIKEKVSRAFSPVRNLATTDSSTEIEVAMRSRRDIDPDVIDAVLCVPREQFVNPPDLRRANDDRALSIGKGQTISQPSLVAHMISELRLTDERGRVLDVGCGSGYQAAVLSRLAEQVITARYQERHGG